MSNRTRRDWLRAVGATGVVGIAGCSSSGETESDERTETGGETDMDKQTGTDEEGVSSIGSGAPMFR